MKIAYFFTNFTQECQPLNEDASVVLLSEIQEPNILNAVGDVQHASDDATRTRRYYSTQRKVKEFATVL